MALTRVAVLAVQTKPKGIWNDERHSGSRTSCRIPEPNVPPLLPGASDEVCYSKLKVGTRQNFAHRLCTGCVVVEIPSSFTSAVVQNKTSGRSRIDRVAMPPVVSQCCLIDRGNAGRGIVTSEARLEMSTVVSRRSSIDRGAMNTVVSRSCQIDHRTRSFKVSFTVGLTVARCRPQCHDSAGLGQSVAPEDVCVVRRRDARSPPPSPWSISLSPTASNRLKMPPPEMRVATPLLSFATLPLESVRRSTRGERCDRHTDKLRHRRESSAC